MALVMTRQAARMHLMDATIIARVQVGTVSAWCREHRVDRRTFYRHRARLTT